MKKKVLAMVVSISVLFTNLSPLMRISTESSDVNDILEEDALKNQKKMEIQQLEIVNNKTLNIKSNLSDSDKTLAKKEINTTEENQYSGRFIIKYSDKKKIKRNIVKEAAEEAYEWSKLQMQEYDNESVQQSEGMEADIQKQFRLKRDSVQIENEVVTELQFSEIMEGNEGHEIIELLQNVNPIVFIDQMMEKLGDKVSYVQPDYIMNLSSEESELRRGSENKSGGDESRENVNLDLEQDLERAWETSKGDGVTVALIDSGVDITHPLLIDKIADGYDFYNNSSSVYCSELGMEQAHGTHIAGIIAQSAPEAKIMPIKVFEYGKAYTSDIIKAIHYAEANGAAIVNMSFGSTENNPALREVMEQSNMFFVCAAGNSRKNVDESPIYPASFKLDNAISVAALNQDSGMSYFSNYGVNHVDIAAYGREVYSTYPNGKYGIMNGTSMAAGYITAASALVASVSENDNIKDILKNSSDKLSCLEGKTDMGNKVNFTSAVKGIINNEVSVVTPEDDFDVFDYQPTAEQSWELYSDSPNIAVSASLHTMTLKQDGTVWTWGYNGFGQLGNGERGDEGIPTRVIGLQDIVAISAGGYHSLALKSDGTVWAWGNNQHGELGTGNTYDLSIPMQVVIPSGQSKVKAISAGDRHNFIICEDGTAWAWGENMQGKLGLGITAGNQVAPVKINGLNSVKAISAGLDTSIAITENEECWIWGNHIPSEGCGEFGEASGTPIRLNMLNGAKAIAGGHSTGHGVIKDDNRTLWVWDCFYSGTGTKVNEADLPFYIMGTDGRDFTRIREAYLGQNGGMALKSDGSVWKWGDQEPMQVSGLPNVKTIAAGGDHSVALCEDGSVYTWGSNLHGQLGDGMATTEREKPYRVSFKQNTSFENAEEIVLNSSITDEIIEMGEHRYYKFIPNTTTDYTIETISDMDTHGYLYNSEKIEIASGTDGWGNGESSNNYDLLMKQRLIAGETYYIDVGAYLDKSTGCYDIKVSYWDDYKDTKEKAETINTGVPIDGIINFSGDIDMFRFVPRVTGTYIIQSVSNIDTYGIISDENGVIVQNDDGNGAGEGINNRDFYLKYKLTAFHTYYISIRGYSANVKGNYTIKADLPIDYGAAVENVILDVPIDEGASNMIQYRYYKFVPQITADYGIQTIGNMDTRGYLYDADKNLLMENTNGWGAGESSNYMDFFIKYRLLAGKTYYIDVQAHPQNDPSSFAFKICYWDDYKDKAVEISEGTPLQGEINYPGDSDTFQFTSRVTGNYNIQSNSNMDTVGSITDDNGSIAKNDDGDGAGDSGNKRDFFIQCKLTAWHTYYISIRAFSGNMTGTYTIKADLQDDYGNIIKESFNITEKDKIEGKIDYTEDVDMFNFTASETANYAIQSISDFDTYGCLYSSDGTEIVSNDDGKAAGESSNSRDFYIKYKLIKGETYFISIRGSLSFDMGAYQLKIGKTDDYGNTFSDAYNLMGKEKLEGEIDYSGDVDMFRFTPDVTGYYVIQSYSNFDTCGFLYKASGAEIVINNHGLGLGEDSHYRYFYAKNKFIKGETYYIAVMACSSNLMGEYMVTVELPDDYGNTIDKAHNVGMGITNGEFEYVGDIDMFAFKPASDGYYIIQSISKPIINPVEEDDVLDMIGTLCYPTGNSIFENDESPGAGESVNPHDFYIRYYLYKDVTYYIKVREKTYKNLGEYDLRITYCIYSASVNNYYDQAFNIRYSKGGNRALKINEVNAVANRIFKSVLNLDIMNNGPVLITSTADNCKIKRGVGISKGTIDQPCPGGAGHVPSCTGWDQSYLDFIEKYPGSDKTVSILWFGNMIWENGVPYNRSFSWIDGGITIQTLDDNNSDFYQNVRTTLLHEMAHQFGADDHYHEILPSGKCRGGKYCKSCNPNTGRPEKCLMNLGSSLDLDSRPINDIFCAGCLQDILNHLDNHHGM